MSVFQEKIKETMKENTLGVAQYHCSHDDELWRLNDQGFLFKLFQESSTSATYMDFFSERVKQVVEMRNRMVEQVHQGRVVAGRILIFDPSTTMYDGIAEEVTDGFFDSDDVPPPELWLGMNDGKLAAFIPSVFASRANEGVECCLGGCLEWATDMFDVNL